MPGDQNSKGSGPREFYRLWWEFLNRSDVYQQVCHKVKVINRLREDGSPVPKEDNLQLLDDAVSKGYYATSDSVMTGPDYDPEFYMLYKYYPHFGDAFIKEDFEAIWSRILTFHRNERPDFVKWESESIKESFGFARMKSKASSGQQVIELGSERAYPLQFKIDDDRFPLGDMGTYLCYIDFKADAEQLLDDFKNFLSLNWRNFHTPIRPQFLSRVPSNARTDNLWRYLKVFDAKEQQISDTVIAQGLLECSKEESASPDMVKRIRREYLAAKNVIWNIEHGIFPKVTR